MDQSKSDRKLADKRHSLRRRCCRRRQEFLEQACSTVAPEIFSSAEAFDLFFGPWPEARRALIRATRRQSAAPVKSLFVSRPTVNSVNAVIVPRPSRELSLLNRSFVFPPLVPVEVEIEAVIFNEILVRLQSDYHGSPRRQADGAVVIRDTCTPAV